ncbi:hypothetical protein TcBrA4_0106120 [Trypanosoma cruzi]|nr:hypothetical protein TcBrA4_0106120 [Trypanosoma cruzi]
MRRISSVILGVRVASFATTSVAFLQARAGGGLTDEEQRELEEEEFRVMDAAREEAELLPIVHRLAAKADALDAELRRLSYVLFEKPQLVMDTRSATLTGRPTSILTVMRRYNAGSRHTICPAGWVKPLGSSSWIVQAYKVAHSAGMRLCGRRKARGIEAAGSTCDFDRRFGLHSPNEKSPRIEFLQSNEFNAKTSHWVFSLCTPVECGGCGAECGGLCHFRCDAWRA